MLLSFPCQLLVSPRKSQQTPAQSAAGTELDPGRNSDLRGSVDRKFPDLDDGEEELVGLGLDGS